MICIRKQNLPYDHINNMNSNDDYSIKINTKLKIWSINETNNKSK